MYSDLAGLDDANHKWKPFEGDENVFDETPEVYPFDETKGGHEWKTYRTESGAADIKEFNVMDTGSTLAGVRPHPTPRVDRSTKPFRTDSTGAGWAPAARLES